MPNSKEPQTLFGLYLITEDDIYAFMGVFDSKSALQRAKRKIVRSGDWDMSEWKFFVDAVEVNRIQGVWGMM